MQIFLVRKLNKNVISIDPKANRKMALSYKKSLPVRGVFFWRKYYCVSVLMLGFCLASCVGSQHQTPVQSRQQPPSIKIGSHIVAQGETLFSIAWAYNLDYRALADANGIDRSYTIYPGQKLHLNASSRSSASTAVPTSKVKKPTYSPVKNTPKSVSKTVKKPSSSYSATASNGSLSWQWPAKGKVVQRFSASGKVNKGIDIEGKLGDAVSASAEGSVVYAGTGLLGYGKLVIIKHNDKFLSAYAHNRKLLVNEGDSVKAGEKIAEIGASGTQKIKLHFEIRRDGKPTDPEKYLPRR